MLFRSVVASGTITETSSSLGSTLSRTLDVEVDPAQFVLPTGRPFDRILAFPSELKISYPERVYDEDTELIGIGLGDQTSWIRLLGELVPFTTDGRLLDDRSLQISGYWSIQRLCHALPKGYMPE